jgi:hypothetical protein
VARWGHERALFIAAVRTVRPTTPCADSPFGDKYVISLGYLVTMAVTIPLGFVVRRGIYGGALAVRRMWQLSVNRAAGPMVPPSFARAEPGRQHDRAGGRLCAAAALHGESPKAAVLAKAGDTQSTPYMLASSTTTSCCC